MKYEIVLKTADGIDVLNLTEDNLFPALEIRGFRFIKLNQNAHNRQELQGQPKFTGLLGPMYGGTGVIRYENTAAYDYFSA